MIDRPEVFTITEIEEIEVPPAPDYDADIPPFLRKTFADTSGTFAETTDSIHPEGKHTNPKDAIGSGKLPLELVPDTMTYYASTAFLEGALKYGRFNWRCAGVRSSIYRAAAQRHLNKWWNGEDTDEKTGVHHLASVLACVGILLDAEVCEKLNDDRPPAAYVSILEEELTPLVDRLKDLFKDHEPHQYTIDDTV